MASGMRRAAKALMASQVESGAAAALLACCWSIASPAAVLADNPLARYVSLAPPDCADASGIIAEDAPTRRMRRAESRSRTSPASSRIARREQEARAWRRWVPTA